MPTSNPQINDPEGQSVMDVFIEAGADPSAAYNATQGIQNMSGDKVIAEIGGIRTDVNAAIEVMRAEVNAAIEVMRAEVNLSIGELGARIDTLESTTSARLDAIDAQLALLSWAVIAAFTILTATATTGFLRANGWWPRAKSEPGAVTSQSPDE